MPLQGAGGTLDGEQGVARLVRPLLCRHRRHARLLLGDLGRHLGGEELGALGSEGQLELAGLPPQAAERAGEEEDDVARRDRPLRLRGDGRHQRIEGPGQRHQADPGEEPTAVVAPGPHGGDRGHGEPCDGEGGGHPRPDPPRVPRVEQDREDDGESEHTTEQPNRVEAGVDRRLRRGVAEASDGDDAGGGRRPPPDGLGPRGERQVEGDAQGTGHDEATTDRQCRGETDQAPAQHAQPTGHRQHRRRRAQEPIGGHDQAVAHPRGTREGTDGEDEATSERQGVREAEG